MGAVVSGAVSSGGLTALVVGVFRKKHIENVSQRKRSSAYDNSNDGKNDGSIRDGMACGAQGTVKEGERIYTLAG
jgi:hypothetical protein